MTEKEELNYLRELVSWYAECHDVFYYTFEKNFNAGIATYYNKDAAEKALFDYVKNMTEQVV